MTSDRNASHPLLGKKLGPYRIETVLGEGGMGTVFRATVRSAVHGLRRGTTVAVKTIREHVLGDADAVARFEREGRLGLGIDHPNVVKTYEIGTRRARLQKVHLLVMEYVEGQTLAELLEELGCVPEGLCRHVGHELAKGLTAVHAAGAMHRDIKPSNVLITPDHVVKLMDLGIARSAEESARISATGAFVGSLAYAAPEQLLTEGSDLDPRIDLWATGVSLYELASGVHPFMADSMGHVIQRIVKGETQRLGELQPQVSPFFEELVHQLLIADPDQRLGPADALVAALDAAESSSWWLAHARSLRRATKKPIRRVRIPRETAVYGREGELATLRSCFERAKAGDGNLLLIEGEAGVGKTRVIDEFVAELEQRGEDVNVLIGGYPPGGAATAARAFTTAYREHFGDDDLESAIAPHLAITPTLVPAFVALLRGDVAAPGSERLTRDSVQTVFVHATRSLAAERTTILWIDDLHFAPDGGRGLLAALALAAPGHRILLIATARPGLPSEWVMSVEGLEQTARLELHRLTPLQLQELIADALGSDDLALELAPTIATKSDGNPFFAFEILKELRRQGVLRQTDAGAWQRTSALGEVAIPSSVMDLIEARLSALSEEERDLLDVAACIGFAFDPLLVGEVTGLPRVPLLTRLAHVERRHRLVRSAGRTTVFDHHQVQEALHQHLPELLRETYHASIAEALETRADAADKDPGDIDGALAVELCEHFLSGGRGERAVHYLGAALDHLTGRYLSAPAATLANRVLRADGLVQGRQRVALLLRVVDVTRRLGRVEEQGTALEEADAVERSIADVDPPNGKVALALGAYLVDLARFDEALAAFDRAEREGAACGDAGLVATATTERGFTLFRLGRTEEARAQIERAIEQHETRGDADGIARAVGHLGVVLWQTGRLEEAKEQFTRVVDACRASGDLLYEATATGNLGTVLYTQGLFAEARRHYERYFEISRRLGHRAGEAVSTVNLGTLLKSKGLLGEAQRRLRRSLEISREMGERRREAVALLNLGSLQSESGAAEAASQNLRAAVSLARELGAQRELVYALSSLADHAHRCGAWDEAHELLAESVAGARRIKEIGALALCLVELGALLHERGDAAAARTRFTEGLDLATEAGLPGTLALARAHLAALDPGHAEAALASLREHEQSIGPREAMQARFLLFRATGDAEHLTEAHRLLLFLRDHAAEEHRTSILENVPLHRDILAAWDGSHRTPPAGE